MVGNDKRGALPPSRTGAVMDSSPTGPGQEASSATTDGHVKVKAAAKRPRAAKNSKEPGNTMVQQGTTAQEQLQVAVNTLWPHRTDRPHRSRSALTDVS